MFTICMVVIAVGNSDGDRMALIALSRSSRDVLNLPFGKEWGKQWL